MAFWNLWYQKLCSAQAILSPVMKDGMVVLERETGFEPATSTLARSHSTS